MFNRKNKKESLDLDGSLNNSKSSEYIKLSNEIADLRKEIVTNTDVLQYIGSSLLEKVTDLVNFDKDEKARFRERRF